MWQLTIYCHWMPWGAMSSLTYKMHFGAPGHQPPHFDGFIYIRYGAPPY